MELWHDFVSIISEWNEVSICLRLLCSMCAGVIIGIDREYKNRAAGVKTHVLVCVGAALVMITSEYIAVRFPDLKSDISRIGAQVVSGIGFLGAGTIIVTGKNQIRGLTTAAGLWACACTGLAIGIGFIQGTLMAVALILFTFKILNFLDIRIQKNKKKLDVYIEFENSGSVQNFIREMRQKDIKISDLSFFKSKIKSDGPIATLTCELTRAGEGIDFLEELQNMEYIKYVEEL